ncbi:MAG: phenylalanine--tRNA ligase subunit beta [Gammaproteobacteria bacterium]|nr:phenylalanine--tRNA ligase subunit beta [Gammaproteobacteria bacterium]
MKVSEEWLREWAPATVPTAELCDLLTNAGLEVDGTEPVAGEFSGVVVGRIVAVEPHPNADKLSVCVVDVGEAAPLNVVCGAPNAAPGLVAPLARVGAVLPGDVRVRAAEMRGVASAGMLCSAAELGIGSDADGVMELDKDHVAGDDLRRALHLDDTTIDIDLTPNRGDALSVRGLAREVGLLCDVPVTAPSIPAVPASTDAAFPVRLSQPEDCPRYLGRVIEGIDTTRPSPLWMRERLRRSGLRSIDPVVDVTNYVLLELGQPMHAFDLDRLRGGIDVRRAIPSERITLIDGRDATLNDAELVIADDSGAVAMAGVMGGARTAVRASTINVFLECAFFAPLAVMGTARRFGLHTDAAHRYERGVDYQLQHMAVERATALLLEIVGGAPGPVVDATSEAHLPVPNHVTLRRARLDALVGEAVPPEVTERVLDRLGFAPKASGEGVGTRWVATSPSYRFDIEREEDLVEEVLRVHGYNTVASHPPKLAQPLGHATRSRVPTARIADLLVDLGYSEAITYSFVDPVHLDLFEPDGASVAVVNAVSREHSVMRSTLLPGLAGALAGNLARRASRVRLFEIGQCFLPGTEGEVQAQQMLCAGIAYGAREAESWAQDGSQVDFFDIKGDVERLLAPGGREATFVADDHPALHPGQRAQAVLDGEPVGCFGRLHPEVERTLDLPPGVFVFELSLEGLLGRRPRRNAGVSRHPSVRRDLALLLHRDVPAATVEAITRTQLGELLREFAVFDLYTGEGIDSSEKSLAIALTLQHPSRTLEEGEINDSVDRVVAALAREVGARLRSGVG